ncbi:hypothetical protein, partial [Cellulomonas sp. HZM]|uniref:hypothetical protein n=1 Tax=Cellulomonas sp. HZM TaxID=1454010 RepID=UPI001E452CEF
MFDDPRGEARPAAAGAGAARGGPDEIVGAVEALGAAVAVVLALSERAAGWSPAVRSAVLEGLDGATARVRVAHGRVLRAEQVAGTSVGPGDR